jgi:hypothetical protein
VRRVDSDRNRRDDSDSFVVEKSGREAAGGGKTADLEAAVARLERQSKVAEEAIAKSRDLTERREARAKFNELKTQLKEKEEELTKAKRGVGATPIESGRGSGIGGGYFKGGKEIDAPSSNSSKGVSELESTVARLERRAADAAEDITKARDLTQRREARAKHNELQTELTDKKMELAKAKRGDLGGGGGVRGDPVRTTGIGAGGSDAEARRRERERDMERLKAGSGGGASGVKPPQRRAAMTDF